MPHPPEDMVEVDLRAGTPRPDDGAPPHRPHVTRARVARVLVVVVVLAAAVAMTARTVADRREAALLAEHAALPGVSASLRDPLGETVRLPAGGLLAVDGDTVLTRGGPAAATAIVALDARTGATRWVLDPAPPGLADPSGCVVHAERRLAACAVRTPAPAVVHLDLTDGSVVATTTLPEDVVDWTVLGGDVVVTAREAGRLVLARVAPGTATVERGAPGVRWRVSVTLGGREDARPLLLGARDGYVTVSGALGVVVRAEDGRLLGAWTPARGYRRVDVTTGPAGFGVWRAQLRGRWHDPSGVPGAVLQGGPVTERVTDGSDPDVVLTLTPLLTAVDVRTGTVLWQRGDGGYLQPSALPVRLDGLVVLPERDRLLGVEVATGRVRWSVPAPTTTQTLFSRPLTDGRRLVLTDLDEAGSLVLRALDLGTGEDVWRVPAPPASVWVYGVGGRGVMQGGGDVVVLG